MSVTEGPIHKRITSPQGFTAISRLFAMDWASIWKDIVGGLLIAGALGAWVPSSFWQAFFLEGHPFLARLWGPLVGPLVAILWNGDISFGGVMAFIFADLIILPILNIYRKYYGGRMTLFPIATFYAAMVASVLLWRFLKTGGPQMLREMD